MNYIKKAWPGLLYQQSARVKYLHTQNKADAPSYHPGKSKTLLILLITTLITMTQVVVHAQVKLNKVAEKNKVIKPQVATPVTTTSTKTPVVVNKSATVTGNNINRINTSSVALLKNNISTLREGDYALMSLKLPGNNKESDYYVKKRGTKLILDGDIIVYDYALMSTKSYSKDDNHPLLGANDLYRWPGGDVPVVLDNSVFETDSYNIIKSAFDYFNFNTGIVFKERTNEEDYVYITVNKDDGSGRGGFSPVGRQRGGSNVLVLTQGGFDRGTVLHELMHAIGFYHEQGRPDRDQFVDIHWDKINEASKHDFQIEYDGTIRSNYDYCSIMQYPSMAFGAAPGAITITCKSNGVVAPCPSCNGVVAPCPSCIGAQTTLTKMDRDGIDKLYGGIGVSRFPSNMPFIYSKVPIAGCIGVDDQLIKAKWQYYKTALGDCQTGVISLGISNTTYVQFEGGAIYHSPHGVFAVYGNIYQLFKAGNGVGKVGFPLADESDITDADHNWNKEGYTRISKFEKGVIIWGPNKNAKEMTNENFEKGPFSHNLSDKVQAVPVPTQKTKNILIRKKK